MDGSSDVGDGWWGPIVYIGQGKKTAKALLRGALSKWQWKGQMEGAPGALPPLANFD